MAVLSPVPVQIWRPGASVVGSDSESARALLSAALHGRMDNRPASEVARPEAGGLKLAAEASTRRGPGPDVAHGHVPTGPLSARGPTLKTSHEAHRPANRGLPGGCRPGFSRTPGAHRPAPEATPGRVTGRSGLFSLCRVGSESGRVPSPGQPEVSCPAELAAAGF